MKKLFFLLIAATGALSAFAQAPAAPDMPQKKSFTPDSLLGRWVIDVNMLGGMLNQNISTNGTMGNYLNALSDYDNGGNLKFTNGSSVGFDAQLGFFFGHKRHFGIGAGFMYLSQKGDITMSDPFHVQYQSTDAHGDVFRQIITSNQPIKESVKITNMNIPIVLKYKKRFSKVLGFTADAGILINVQEKNDYTSNASFDYEAIYNYAVNNDGSINHTNYDNSLNPVNGNDVLYTKAAYVASTKYPTIQDYFNTAHGLGYNVGLGVAPNKNTGSVSYTTGSIGFIAQPSLNFFLSDNVALNLGVYYMYQPNKNTTKSDYQLSNKMGDYNSVLNTVSTANSQSYGINAGVRVFFGKMKDTDHDGVPDSKDQCPDVPGLVQFMGCPDQDGDGIPDNQDSCVNVPGIMKFHGCPDSDGDGIPDKDDACPFQAGTSQFNGCPDRDGDGIIDKDDLCPDKAGPQKYHGCPDSDGDGVPDNLDKCPDVAGPESNNGCPVVTPPAPTEEAVKVSTPIRFAVNRTTISESSYPVLEEAVKRLKADKDSYIIVDGYTDITGKAPYNQRLSVKRANAVKKQLVKMGVSAKRVKIVGHGSKAPAASNDTPEGRMENRRAVMELNMAD